MGTRTGKRPFSFCIHPHRKAFHVSIRRSCAVPSGRQRRRFRPPSSASLTSGYGREETRPCISESEGRPPDSRQAAVFRSRNNIRVQKTNDPAGRRGREVHGAGDGTRTREYKLGKLFHFTASWNPNMPSDLAPYKLLSLILPNVLDEILEKRGDFQSARFTLQDAQKPPSRATFD